MSDPQTFANTHTQNAAPTWPSCPFHLHRQGLQLVSCRKGCHSYNTMFSSLRSADLRGEAEKVLRATQQQLILNSLPCTFWWVRSLHGGACNVIPLHPHSEGLKGEPRQEQEPSIAVMSCTFVLCPIQNIYYLRKGVAKATNSQACIRETL